MWGNLSYDKSVYDPIPTLAVGIETPRQFRKQINKLCSLLNVQVCSLFLAKVKGKEGLFYWVQKRRAHRDITPKSTWLSQEMKTWFSPFPPLSFRPANK